MTNIKKRDRLMARKMKLSKNGKKYLGHIQDYLPGVHLGHHKYTSSF